MQVAQVVPKTRTQKKAVFDYSIPPEILPLIQPGILVEIPFHGRRIEGIIVDIKRSSPIANLMPISRVIDPVPVVDKTHLKLACWMAGYYLEPLGKTLFENIVPPAIKTIKKTLIQSENILPRLIFQKKAPKAQKYLVIADFNFRRQFYLKAIQKTLKGNRSVIILLPDLSLIPYFTKYFKEPYAILHAKMSITQRWLEWHKIRQNKVKIIIGSQSALFAPAGDLGLIIIDQEENPTYKNDRSPRFHAVQVANELSKLTAVNLVLGSLAPRLATFHQALQGQFKIIKSSIPTRPKITTVDMNSERHIISHTLEEKIKQTLNSKQKIILVLNRKGAGTKFSCPDCRWISLCQKCGLPLVPQKTQNICYRCRLSEPHPEKCPVCQSVRVKAIGVGTSRLKKFISDLFPETFIIQIEKEIDGRALFKNWQIAIVTTYALKFNFPQIGLVGIIEADQGLNFPDFSAPEKTFASFYKFLKIGERGIIQTRLPENNLIKSLARLDYERFFLDEIAQRKKFAFPPFVRIIRLLYKNQAEDMVKKETQRIYELLKPIISFNRYTISPPHWLFIKKEQGKFRRQIIIKIPIKNQIAKDLQDNIKNLPQGWVVDVDPINLL